MNQYSYLQNQQLLSTLMQQANISDIDELSCVAKVHRLQIIRLERGLILRLSLETVAKIARALQISIDQLLETFTSSSVVQERPQESEISSALVSCQQEYQKLQQEMEQQRHSLQEEFQRTSIETMESWLLQWPTAAAAVRKNPQLPAARLLSLVQPVEQLLVQWGVETIASVGEELPYDPQWHKLMKGSAEPGDLVEVRYVGYKQGDRILYKAKVSPVEKPSGS